MKLRKDKTLWQDICYRCCFSCTFSVEFISCFIHHFVTISVMDISDTNGKDCGCPCSLKYFDKSQKQLAQEHQKRNSSGSSLHHSTAQNLQRAENCWQHWTFGRMASILWLLLLLLWLLFKIYLLPTLMSHSFLFFFQKMGKEKDKKVQITEWHAIPTYYMFLSVFQFGLNSIIIKALCVWILFTQNCCRNVRTHACLAIVMLI